MNPSALIRRPAAAMEFPNAANDAALTMSSMDLLEMVNTARVEFDERTVRRNDFTARCKDELDGEHYEIFVVPNGNGTQSEALRLTRDQCALIAMRESKGVRRRVLDRLKALEATIAAPPVPTELTRLEILQMAIESERGKLAAEAKLAVMAPQVEALHRIALTPTDATMCLTDTAKHLQIKPRKMIPWLTNLGWVYRRTEDSRVCGIQTKLDVGYLSHKIVDYGGSDGTPRQAAQVRVTQRGLAKLAHLIETGRGPAK